MKNKNIYQNLNKLVITTKKFVLLTFAISNVISSNADLFSQQFSADSLSQLPNPSIQEQPTISNAEELKEMEDDEVEERNLRKNEGPKEIQTSLSADEKHTTTFLPDLKSYILTLIDKELNIESTKKYHSFLRVYKNIIMYYYDDFYIKIIDKNKCIIASFCLTTYDSSKNVKVDMKSFMKRATEHYVTHSENEENYYEKNAVAAFCDKDSGEMIIKLLESICETAGNYCENEDEDESDTIVHGEEHIIRDISETIIDFIRKSSKTLNSKGQKILYPICYEIFLMHDGDNYGEVSNCCSEKYIES